MRRNSKEVRLSVIWECLVCHHAVFQNDSGGVLIKGLDIVLISL